MEVKSLTATLDKKMSDGQPIGVEDNAAVIVRFAGGAVGSMLFSWTSYGKQDNSTTLNCENGVLQINRDEAPLKLTRKDGTCRVFGQDELDQAPSIVDLFVSGIHAGKSPVSAEEGLRAMRIVEGVGRADGR